MSQKIIDIYDVVLSVAANIDYIKKQFVDFELSNHSLSTRILIVGHGRSGKDESALYLGRRLGLRYTGSTSLAVRPLLAHAIYGKNDLLTQEHCYAHRHEDREYWYEYCNLLRRIDPLMLIKLCLSFSDILVGTRSFEELNNAVKVQRPTHILWLERSVPIDPTLEFRYDDLLQYARMANVIRVDNTGSIEELYNNLDILFPIGT
ncbi:MAG: hypothetical protein KGN01_05330 [Patescibacteria group bacterium]|nr:hypothetical protein [Patescibacteria group bacterium]